MEAYCDSSELLKEVLRNLAQQQSTFEEQLRVLGDIAEGQTSLRNVLDHHHEVLRADFRAAQEEWTCRPSRSVVRSPTLRYDSVRSSSSQRQDAGPELEHILPEHTSEQDSTTKPGAPEKKSKFGVLASRQKIDQGMALTRSQTESVRELSHPLRRFVVSGKFDIIMGLVIWMNMVTLSLQLQIKGMARSSMLGLDPGSGSMDKLEPVLEWFDFVFIVIYWVEFLMRVWALRRAFFRSCTNIFDFALVLLCTLDLASTVNFGISGVPALSRLVRLIRLLRVARLLKVVRMLSVCRELYLLVKTISTSILSLCWGMLLLFQIIFASSLLLCTTLSSFIEDTLLDLPTRLWVHEHFGTVAKATWTMFECTFSPKWQTFARPFVEDLHFLYLFFWLFYIIIVNFAIMRIVSAMFIKQTMTVASTEEEKIFAMKGKQMERFAVTLREIFSKADEDHDHDISTEQFEAVMARDDVHEYFEKLELEIEEVKMLFTVLSEPDGYADYEEFLSGAIRMKSNARTVDTIQLLHEQLIARRSLESVARSIDDLRLRLSSRSDMPPALATSNLSLHVLEEEEQQHSPSSYEINEEKDGEEHRHEAEVTLENIGQASL